MSNNKNVDSVEGMDYYLKNALDINLFFLKVRVSLNILFHIMMFLSFTYLLHELIINTHKLNPEVFIREFLFLIIVPILFKIVFSFAYKKVRDDHYKNLTKNRNGQ